MGHLLAAAVHAPKYLLKKSSGYCTPDCRAATGVIVSALLYLFDLATNIATLHAYYKNVHRYSWFAHHFYRAVFSIGLVLIVVAHISNSIIFWFTLDPQKHPLRLAYFLPLIHLWRLVKCLLLNACIGFPGSFRDEMDEEATNLYNILGMALETGPLLILQMFVAFYGFNEVHYAKLFSLSIGASFLSSVYSATRAVLAIIKHPSHSNVRTAWFTIIAGLHAMAALFSRIIMFGAVTVPISAGVGAAGYSMFSVLLYVVPAVLVPWGFYFFYHELRSSQDVANISSVDTRKKSRIKELTISLAHSFALAHVSFTAGTLYVATKSLSTQLQASRFRRFLIIATSLHVLVELFGIVTVILQSRIHENNWVCSNFLDLVAFPYPRISICRLFEGTYGIAIPTLVLSTWAFLYLNAKPLPASLDSSNQGEGEVEM